MKIRIKGNSLRIRLSKSEVNQLAGEGYLQEQTAFGGKTLVYAVQVKDTIGELSADFVENKITLYVPRAFIIGWPVNTIVGFEADMPLNENDSLHLKLEKDFACIDATTEDQSDNYENPNKNC
ncbi:MAG: hypothetical protein JWP81_1896 [Ferruginibacter sp.]|nr:hypothetical protein [Ferruginibacter sp.]